MFTKAYITSQSQLLAVPASERWKYYLDRKLLQTIVHFSDDDDPMVTRRDIEKAGIACEPFWEDTAGYLDNEGKAFQRYRQMHPEFDICIRKIALERLLQAQKILGAQAQIVIKAAYRPLAVQRDVFNAELTVVRSARPEWSEKQSRAYLLEYVTDPEVYLPPHASGGTVDIVLKHPRSNELLDMGVPVNSVDDRSWTANMDGLTSEQKNNRKFITKTMLQAGFANLASEWWHYSFGDQRWAVFYSKAEALYSTPEGLK